MASIFSSSAARHKPYRTPALWLLASFSLSRPSSSIAAATFVPTAFSWFQKRSSLSMAKRDSPSAQRNKEPIWNILSNKVLPLLPKTDGPTRVLEIAAGCGVHSLHFSLQLLQNETPFLWYPSDPDESSRASIQAYLEDESSLKEKLQPPLDISLAENGAVGDSVVKGKVFDLILCINMVHISPWPATLGLMKLAGGTLAEGGILYLYGPYKVNGEAVESNLSFDRSLRSRDPSWGVRNLEDVLKAAKKQGLVHVETIEMPANNLSVILQKR